MTGRILAALLLLASPGLVAQVRAANADHPHQNVNKANDKGGDTGNSKVEQLNRGQLDANQKPPTPPPTQPKK